MDNELDKGIATGKVIAVASGKGGTGKTTTVAAVSSCLAALGHKTLCVDFDAGMRNLDLALCMSDFAVIDYADVVAGRFDLDTAVSACPSISNLYFLTAPPTEVSISHDDKNTVGDKHISLSLRSLKEMFNTVRGTFDYCLIDSPPGLSNGFQLAHAVCDISVLVANAETPSIRDAAAAAILIRDLGVENLRLVINRANRKKLRQISTTVDDIIDTVGAQLLGVIVEDPYVFDALHESTPLILYKKRKSAYDFLDIARRITGEDIPSVGV